jgi:AraC-like DNA-binding protein
MRTEPSDRAPISVDRLTGLLRRFEIEVTLLDAADPLGMPRAYGDDQASAELGYLHVLSRGAIELATLGAAGPPTQIARPSLVLTPAPLPHRISPVERPALTCAALRFAHGAEHPLVRALPNPLVVEIDAVPSLAPTLELLVSEGERVRCGQPLIASRLLEIVLLQLLRWVFDHPDAAAVSPGLARGLSDPGIAASLAAVHDDPAANWTLASMARLAAMSRSSYAERFRSLVGTTPAAYVASYRIALAKQGLLRGEQVAILARELGYASGPSLSRAFTSCTGVAPSAWLRSQRAD